MSDIMVMKEWHDLSVMGYPCICHICFYICEYVKVLYNLWYFVHIYLVAKMSCVGWFIRLKPVIPIIVYPLIDGIEKENSSDYCGV